MRGRGHATCVHVDLPKVDVDKLGGRVFDLEGIHKAFFKVRDCVVLRKPERGVCNLPWDG